MSGVLLEQLDSLDALGGILLDVELRFNETTYKEVLTEFQETLRLGEVDAFANEREPGGTPWAELSPVTIAKKGHDIILFETGALQESLTNIGGTNNISEVEDMWSVFGTSDEKAAFHQFGTSRMPARPPVGTNDEAVDELAESIADHAVESLKYKLGKGP